MIKAELAQRTKGEDLPRSVKDTVDGVGGGATLDHVGEDDAATICDDDVAAADVVSPVLALHEDVGQDLTNQFLWLVFVEDNHGIDAAQRTKNEGPVFLAIDGSAGLGPTDRGVAIEPENEGIALLAGEVEIGDVAAVEDIEAAIGKDELFTNGVQFVAEGAGLGNGPWGTVHQLNVLEERIVVGLNGLNLGIVGRAEALEDIKGTEVEAASLVGLATGVVDDGEIGHGLSNLGMHRAEGFFPDGEGLHVEIFGALVILEIGVSDAEIIGGGSDLGMIGTVDGTGHLHGLLVMALGRSKVSMTLAKSAELVEEHDVLRVVVQFAIGGDGVLVRFASGLGVAEVVVEESQLGGEPGGRGRKTEAAGLRKGLLETGERIGKLAGGLRDIARDLDGVTQARTIRTQHLAGGFDKFLGNLVVFLRLGGLSFGLQIAAEYLPNISGRLHGN